MREDWQDFRIAWPIQGFTPFEGRLIASGDDMDTLVTVMARRLSGVPASRAPAVEAQIAGTPQAAARQ